MKKITSITDGAKQQLKIVLDDQSVVSMQLNYVVAQQGWFYSLAYPTAGFLDYNRRLVNSPNMLRQFRNIIPFGLACTIADGFEPVYQDDFLSGRANLYQLNAADVEEVETLIIVTLPNFIGYPLS